MSSDCIFCKIANKDIPKEFSYEDDHIMVFPDIRPVKPIHLLIVPKKHIPDFTALAEDDLLAKIRVSIQAMVKKLGLEKKGYKLVVNAGGAQMIDHLHVHLLGPMGKAAAI